MEEERAVGVTKRVMVIGHGLRDWQVICPVMLWTPKDHGALCFQLKSVFKGGGEKALWSHGMRFGLEMERNTEKEKNAQELTCHHWM